MRYKTDRFLLLGMAHCAHVLHSLKESKVTVVIPLYPAVFVSNFFSDINLAKTMFETAVSLVNLLQSIDVDWAFPEDHIEEENEKKKKF